MLYNLLESEDHEVKEGTKEGQVDTRGGKESHNKGL